MKNIDKLTLTAIINNLEEIQSNHKNQTLESNLGFYRLPQILELIPMSKSSWWSGINSGKLPKGFNIGSNIAVWLKADIHKLL